MPATPRPPAADLYDDGDHDDADPHGRVIRLETQRAVADLRGRGRGDEADRIERCWRFWRRRRAGLPTGDDWACRRPACPSCAGGVLRRERKRALVRMADVPREQRHHVTVDLAVVGDADAALQVARRFRRRLAKLIGRLRAKDPRWCGVKVYGLIEGAAVIIDVATPSPSDAWRGLLAALPHIGRAQNGLMLLVHVHLDVHAPGLTRAEVEAAFRSAFDLHPNQVSVKDPKDDVAQHVEYAAKTVRPSGKEISPARMLERSLYAVRGGLRNWRVNVGLPIDRKQDKKAEQKVPPSLMDVFEGVETNRATAEKVEAVAVLVAAPVLTPAGVEVVEALGGIETPPLVPKGGAAPVLALRLRPARPWPPRPRPAVGGTGPNRPATAAALGLDLDNSDDDAAEERARVLPAAHASFVARRLREAQLARQRADIAAGREF